jgi:ring-1,2-phenylacetyl-CoA epoxidase subunit PaaC
MGEDAALYDFSLRMGDSTLVLAHRLSQWTGHAPVLEEELGNANVALDLLGQAQLWLQLAAEAEGAGRTPDDLAYLRDAPHYRNYLLVEQPNGDYGATLIRQLYFDAWHWLSLCDLQRSSHERVAEIAAKAEKEVRYHLERSSDWVIRLGDGTEESHQRVAESVTLLWPYTGELFAADDTSAALAAREVVPSDADDGPWRELLGQVFAEATLTLPERGWAQSGGIHGRHTEHLGFMLAEMQFLQRAYPGATW